MWLKSLSFSGNQVVSWTSEGVSHLIGTNKMEFARCCCCEEAVGVNHTLCILYISSGIILLRSRIINVCKNLMQKLLK